MLGRNDQCLWFYWLQLCTCAQIFIHEKIVIFHFWHVSLYAYFIDCGDKVSCGIRRKLVFHQPIQTDFGKTNSHNKQDVSYLNYISYLNYTFFVLCIFSDWNNQHCNWTPSLSLGIFIIRFTHIPRNRPSECLKNVICTIYRSKTAHSFSDTSYGKFN